MKERERNNREMVYEQTDIGFRRYRLVGDPKYFEWYTLSYDKNRSLWRKVLERTVCLVDGHVMEENLIVETGLMNGKHYDIGMCKVCRVRYMLKATRTWKGPYAFGG